VINNPEVEIRKGWCQKNRYGRKGPEGIARPGNILYHEIPISCSYGNDRNGNYHNRTDSSISEMTIGLPRLYGELEYDISIS